MATYDPQRSHARRRVADEDGPAPVDALLGPTPDREPAAAGVTNGPAPANDPAPGDPGNTSPSTRREPLVIDLDPPAPVNVPRHRGRIALYVLAGVSLVLQVLAWRWWRRRRASATGDGPRGVTPS